VHCLLVNTTGELRNFYSHSDIVFVGKSLTADGGQNPIEPGALGKAMIFGPRMQNFTQIAEQFVKRAGAIQVQDAAELEKAIVQLLVDPQKRQQLGANAQLVVRENLGAVEKTVELILQHLAEEEIYVASLNPA
jgi:3-deoxy-D-manno-octulosonic-acid transferase